MDIQKIDVMPTSLYTFKLSDEIFCKIKKLVKEINWNDLPNRNNHVNHGITTPNYQSFHRVKEWQEIVLFIEEKLEKIKWDLSHEYEDIEKLKVSLLWANKNEFNQWHHGHRHSWSILSGCIYVQGEGGDTWLSRKCDFSLPETYLSSYKEPRCLTYKHKFEEGTALVFPSTMWHSVSENTSKVPRITLSFNCFPVGEVGEPETKLIGLNLF